MAGLHSARQRTSLIDAEWDSIAPHAVPSTPDEPTSLATPPAEVIAPLRRTPVLAQVLGVLAACFVFVGTAASVSGERNLGAPSCRAEAELTDSMTRPEVAAVAQPSEAAPAPSPPATLAADVQDAGRATALDVAPAASRTAPPVAAKYVRTALGTRPRSKLVARRPTPPSDNPF